MSTINLNPSSLLERFFSFLGQLATRYRVPIVVGWCLCAVLVALFAPNLEQVTSSNVADLLPANAPFRQAESLLRQSFPDVQARTSAVIAFEATSGMMRDESALQYLETLTDWLQNKALFDNITEMLSPATSTSLMADALIAQDNKAAIILIYFSTDSQNAATKAALHEIQSYLTENPLPNVHTYLTGIAPIVIGYSEAATNSVDRTTGITLILVILILLAVYRSPVSPIIPLLTVGVAYVISRGLIAWIGQSGTIISSYVSVFLVVVLFGAGTDYCLFLISRFREEMSDNNDTAPAVRRTVHSVGETLMSSAGTVIVGFATMMFSEMGLFRNSGPVMAVAIVVVLLSGLTLTPALLSLLGQRVFWPSHAHKHDTGRFYGWVSTLVSKHPLPTILIIIAVLMPWALYATGQRTTYDLLADLPADEEARRGYRVLETHMGAGQMQPLNVVVRGLKPETALAQIKLWGDKIRSVQGVADIRSLSDPLGKSNAQFQNITRVDHQLSLAADVIRQLRQNGMGSDAESSAKPDPARITQALNALPFITEYFDTLEQTFPEIAGNEDLAAVHKAISGLPIAALSGQLPQSLESLETHLTALADAFSGIENAYYLPGALPQSLVDSLGGQDVLKTLNSRYLTPDRTTARFEVILVDNPFSPEAMNTVLALRSLLPNGSETVTGSSVTMTDLRDTMSRDLLRAFAFVLLGVFLVLILLLRAIISPVYLILTILLSYGATMGITRFVSLTFFGTEELTWWVPFFMFVLLVALGMDYNIFLMGRVREEVAHRQNMRDGVHAAIVATGSIITSAGIIMAGTFAAMLASTVVGLRQLGLAVAVGVLLDTFLIRTALAPAIAIVLDRWNWWPGHQPTSTTTLEGEKPSEQIMSGAHTV